MFRAETRPQQKPASQYSARGVQKRCPHLLTAAAQQQPGQLQQLLPPYTWQQHATQPPHQRQQQPN
jgi:hypothetical protein